MHRKGDRKSRLAVSHSGVIKPVGGLQNNRATIAVGPASGTLVVSRFGLSWQVSIGQMRNSRDRSVHSAPESRHAIQRLGSLGTR